MNLRKAFRTRCSYRRLTAAAAFLFFAAENALADTPAQIATVSVAAANHLFVTLNPGDTTKPWQLDVGQTQNPAVLGGDFTGDRTSDVACIDFDSDDDAHVILKHGPGKNTSSTVPWQNRLRSDDQLTYYFVAGDFDGDSRSDVMSFYVQKNGNNTDVYSKVTYGPTGATATADPQDWFFPNERDSAFISGAFRSVGAGNDLVEDIAAISNSTGGNFKARFFVGPSGTYAAGGDWSISGINGTVPVGFRSSDFNGDGYADIAAIFYASTTGQYTAHVVLGPSGTTSRTWNLGTQELVAVVADDFNGDGFGDLAGIRESGSQRAASIALGSSTGLNSQNTSWTLTNTAESSGPYLAGRFSTSQISGTVTFEGGAPFSNVQIDGGEIGITNTAANGTYSIDGFVDGMTYTLVPSSTLPGPNGLGYSFNPVSKTGFINSDTVVNFVSIVNVDTDGDGIFNHIDLDDDNDGLSDLLEVEYGTDPLNPDTDGDGVSDGQEVADGTDPLDRGSNNRPLSTEICSEWNGFLNMWNVKEHINRSTITLDILTTLYDQAGVAQGTQAFSLPPGRHFDLLVHEMDGWHPNAYGKVCSALLNGNPGDLDGRMVYYKEDDRFSNPVNERFEFAFALKFANGLRGRQYVSFNTYQPSLDYREKEYLAANWIQLNNLENSSQRGTMLFYGQDGSVISSQNLMLGPNARVDLGAHNIARSIIGMVAWVPDNPSADFLMRNARYFYSNKNASEDHFLAAFNFDAATGTGRELVVPLDTQNSSSIIEISNTLATNVTTQVQVYNALGQLQHVEQFVLGPHATYHIITDRYLNGQKGMAAVRGSEPESLLMTSMQYGRTATASMSYLYGVPGIEAVSPTLEGSYNSYLNQGCSLLLMNQSNAMATASISMRDGDTLQQILAGEQVQVPARGLVDFDLCARAPANTYGSVTVNASSPNTLAAIVVRKGNRDDFRFPTSLR